MIAPGRPAKIGGQRGDAERHGSRGGQCEALADPQVVLVGDRLREHRPAAPADRAARAASLPPTSWPTGIGSARCRAARAPICGAHPSRGSLRDRPRQRSRPGCRRGWGRGALERVSCEKRSASPCGVTQSSIRVIPRAAAFRPRCRLLLAPWIATLPNTAIAPVAAIASERIRLEGVRSSIDRDAGRRRIERTLERLEGGEDRVKAIGSSNNSADHEHDAAKDRGLWRASRIAVVSARQPAPSSRRSALGARSPAGRVSRLQPLPEPGRSAAGLDSGPSAAGPGCGRATPRRRRSPTGPGEERRRRTSTSCSGANTPMHAAASPAPAASATLCQATIRC